MYLPLSCGSRILNMSKTEEAYPAGRPPNLFSGTTDFTHVWGRERLHMQWRVR